MLSPCTVNARIATGIFFAALLTVSGLASCGGGGGGGGNSTTPTAPAVPTVTVTASPASVPYGSTSSINWSSTNSDGCVTNPSLGVGTSGAVTTPPLISDTTYVITCRGPGGITSQNVTIAVEFPNIASAITGFALASGNTTTVTSANGLANGDSITIYGTTSYNGTFTVANRTNTSFTINRTFVANDATGVWQRTGGMIAGCSTTTTGNPAAIDLANYAPKRYNGVAPLSVFFDPDTLGTALTAQQFHDLEYQWDFGENSAALAALPGGTNWTMGSTNGSRNLARGPVAAHVYETPGLYTVTLSVTDGTNTAVNRCVQIAVQYPDAYFAGSNTICIAANSDPTPGSGGCPSGAAHYQQPNFVTAVNTYKAIGKRVLFKRGDTFTAPAVNVSWATIAVNGGPGIIGAYGSGANPVIQATNTSASNNTYPVLQLSVGSSKLMNDWRIMDLTFDTSTSTYKHIDGITMLGNINQLTILRLQGNYLRTAIGNSDPLLDSNELANPGQLIWDQLAVVDSYIPHVAHDPSSSSGYGYGFYISAQHAFIAGNFINNEGTRTADVSHITRFPYLAKSIIGNNTFVGPGPTEVAIKLHAPIWQTFTGNTTSGSNVITGIANTANYLPNHVISGAGIPPGTTVTSNTTLENFTADTTTGSNTISGIADTTNYGIGKTIAGPGIPGGTRISSITNATTLLLSNSATANATGATLTITATALTLSATATATATATLLTDAQNNTAKNGIGGGYTRWVTLADNNFIGAAGSVIVGIAPQNGGSDERIKDIIVERNLFSWLPVTWPAVSAITSLAARAIDFNCVDATVRNNIFNMTSSAYHQGIEIDTRGIEPQADNIKIYNNTFYSASTGDAFAVGVSARTSNITIVNNLGYAPAANSQPLMMIYDPALTNPTQSFNTSIPDMRTRIPGWVTPTPTVPADFSSYALGFKLTAGSYALSAGTSVPVFSDFFLQSRPPYDLGAAGQ